MMIFNTLIKIKQCLFAPRLYRIYGQGPGEAIYKPNVAEIISNEIISTARLLGNVSIYATPFIFMYIFKRGFVSWNEMYYLMLSFTGIGCFMGFTYGMRAVGRANNPVYSEFLSILQRPIYDPVAYFESIRKYDFDFYAWPPSYTVQQVKSSTWLENKPFVNCANPSLPYYQRVTVQLLAYLAVHSFALYLIYPGTLSIIQNTLWLPLCEGRAYLVNSCNGKRAKVIAKDGNEIDVMFVDNRLDSSKGGILVVCCEGNTGFYEIGIMTSPLKTGYSALGWNHPGFGGSTGTPFPLQEQNAIDAIMKYAINELNFEAKNIVLYGWSIGCYTATWAAVTYTDVRGLILDAPFDDLLPLAENQMPKSWKLLVKEVVRSFVDLHISEMMATYSGKVQLVRRTEDEVICLSPGQLASNRCNFLLIKILEERHPELFMMDTETPIMETLETCIALSDQQRIVLDKTDLPEIKRIILELISRYMRDFRSTHCMPLPDALFLEIMNVI